MSKKIAIIGAGITGSVIARCAADIGINVDIFEKRNHLAGNCYDIEEFNSFTHKYGPHLFHTGNKKVVDFIKRFSQFVPYIHKVHAFVDGQFIPIPYNLKSLEFTHPSYLAKRISQKLIDEFGFGNQVSIYKLLDSADLDIKNLGNFVYKKIFFGYSSKQWGVKDPLSINKNVLDRVPVRINRNTNYFLDQYQFLPKNGYTNMLKNIINSENINIKVGNNLTLPIDKLSTTNTQIEINGKKYDHLFYTGKVDELFSYCQGKLEYRSLNFVEDEFSFSSKRPSLALNYPENFDFTRIVDYSFIGIALGRNVDKSRIVTEYPGRYDENNPNFNEAFYPLFTKEAQEKYKLYEKLANTLSNTLTVCGRLGRYKYFDMDDAIGAALNLVSKNHIFN